MRPFESKTLVEGWEADMIADYHKQEAQLKQEEQRERDWWLETARLSLKSAREQKVALDVSGDIEYIRHCANREGFSLADIGTSEEELSHLVQTGYESEARSWLELARDTYGYSRFSLYLRAVRNSWWSFRKTPKWFWFKILLEAIFCLRSHRTRQDNVSSIREYLAKANLSPTDIGTDEEELIKLGS